MNKRGNTTSARATGSTAAVAPAMFEEPFSGHAVIGAAGGWVEVSARLCAILGYDADELVGLTFRDVTHPDDFPAAQKAFELFERGDICRFRTRKRFRRSDGSTIWADVLIQGMDGAAGGSEGDYRLFVLDVSGRRHLEVAMQRRDERLVQLAALLGHDLRSVLNVMSLHAQLAKASLRDASPRAQSSLDTIVATAHDAAAFMTQLQEYAASLTHHADLDRVSLQHIVAQVLAHLEPQIRAERAQVEVGELPRVLSKEAILSRLLLCIIADSLKHCSVTDPRIEVAAISHVAQRGAAGLVVRDNGAGVSIHERERALTTLFRSDEKSGPAGMGLALALCRQHIEDIGGSIWIESTPGQGRQIAVLLPGG